MRTNKSSICPGKQSDYIAEWLEIAIMTKEKTLDEVTRNSREAVGLHLKGEDLAEMGMREPESVSATREVLSDRQLTTRLRELAKRIDGDVQAGKLHSMEEVFGEHSGRSRYLLLK